MISLIGFSSLCLSTILSFIWGRGDGCRAAASRDLGPAHIWEAQEALDRVLIDDQFMQTWVFLPVLLAAFGNDMARTDSIHANTVHAKITRHLPGHADHGRLECFIGQVAGRHQ